MIFSSAFSSSFCFQPSTSILLWLFDHSQQGWVSFSFVILPLLFWRLCWTFEAMEFSLFILRVGRDNFQTQPGPIFFIFFFQIRLLLLPFWKAYPAELTSCHTRLLGLRLLYDVETRCLPLKFWKAPNRLIIFVLGNFESVSFGLNKINIILFIKLIRHWFRATKKKKTEVLTNAEFQINESSKQPTTSRRHDGKKKSCEAL